jgi:hypothetical protein
VVLLSLSEKEFCLAAAAFSLEDLKPIKSYLKFKT